MAAKSRGLGKGLGALIKKPQPKPAVPRPAAPADGVAEISLDRVIPNKNQPRQHFDEAELAELAASVKQYGILEPIIVRELIDGRYEIIAGERRCRAARLAGLATVPVLVKKFTDAEISEVALIENIQRKDLNAIEEAQAYQRLIEEFGLTQEALSAKIGRSRSHIANFLRLLNLAAEVREHIAKGRLSMGQAKPLLALEDKMLQIRLAQQIVIEGLSARAVEKLIEQAKQQAAKPAKSAKPEPAADPEEVFRRDVEDRIKMALGAKTSLKLGRKKSTIEIEVADRDQLERIIAVITGNHADIVEQKKEQLRQASRHFSV